MGQRLSGLEFQYNWKTLIITSISCQYVRYRKVYIPFRIVRSLSIFGFLLEERYRGPDRVFNLYTEVWKQIITSFFKHSFQIRAHVDLQVWRVYSENEFVLVYDALSFLSGANLANALNHVFTCKTSSFEFKVKTNSSDIFTVQHITVFSFVKLSYSSNFGLFGQA